MLYHLDSLISSYCHTVPNEKFIVSSLERGSMSSSGRNWKFRFRHYLTHNNCFNQFPFCIHFTSNDYGVLKKILGISWFFATWFIWSTTVCCIDWTTIDNHELTFRSVMTLQNLVLAFARPRIHRPVCILMHYVGTIWWADTFAT
jgi:hypothetical protein